MAGTCLLCTGRQAHIITTCYVASALLKLAQLTGNRRYQDAAIEAGLFIETLFTQHQQQHYFVYIPGETTFVYNASLWGAAIASQTAALSGNGHTYDQSTQSC